MGKIKPNVPALILAAGGSKRMGTPKQLLPWGESTLLDNCIISVTESNIEDVYVVLGANDQIIRNSINPTSAKLITHDNWHLGLGSSIAFGTQFVLKSYFQVDGLLIVLADQPQVNSVYLNSLIREFHPKKKQIIATSYQNSMVAGVPAIFDSIYLEQLFLLEGDYGAKQIIKENADYLTTFSPQQDLIDIDTISTYEQLHNRIFKD